MRFDEEGIAAGGYGSVRQGGDKLALAARAGALPAGQLDGVGGVEADGDAELLHEGNAAHIAYEVIVAESRPAFDEQDIFIPCALYLIYDVRHIHRGHELSFFYRDRQLAAGGADDEVSLPAKERWDLHKIAHLRRCLDLGHCMDVAGNRDAYFVADFL